MLDSGHRGHVRDRVFDLDLVPVDRELKLPEPGLLETWGHYYAGGQGLADLRGEIRIAAGGGRDRVRDKFRQCLRGHALLDAQGPHPFLIGPPSFDAVRAAGLPWIEEGKARNGRLVQLVQRRYANRALVRSAQ